MMISTASLVRPHAGGNAHRVESYACIPVAADAHHVWILGLQRRFARCTS